MIPRDRYVTLISESVVYPHVLQNKEYPGLYTIVDTNIVSHYRSLLLGGRWRFVCKNKQAMVWHPQMSITWTYDLLKKRILLRDLVCGPYYELTTITQKPALETIELGSLVSDRIPN